MIYGLFWPKTGMAQIMLQRVGMTSKSKNNSVEVRCHMSEPTKFIVRCCELRKLRTGQTPRVSDRQQMREHGRS